jgi:hypothetical protein
VTRGRRRIARLMWRFQFPLRLVIFADTFLRERAHLRLHWESAYLTAVSLRLAAREGAL